MIQDHKPHIGKNVIETLTLGMYEDARFIYREYIQNAADQIDVAVEQGILPNRSEGKILVEIDVTEKEISISDNATGIKSQMFLRFLGDVANSEKNPSERKGFRGIGRLGGLGYCKKLIFETSYPGEEIKSVMTLDAQMLRDIIDDRLDNTDAAGVISIITTINTVPEAKSKHYFKVILKDITNPQLLEINKVEDYLTLVAPLPFSPEFKFKNEIENYFKESNVALDEYIVLSNSKQLFKAYRNVISDNGEHTNIIAVDCFKIADVSGKLLALGWVGIRDFVNEALTNNVNERGIRLRKSNIQIGNDSTLNRFFRAERTNYRFVGEVHAVSTSLIPNARRDYFNDNRTCQSFEKNLRDFFTTENWENTLAQNASKIHNRIKDIEHYREILEEYETVKDSIDNPAKEAYYRNKVVAAKNKAVKASKDIEKVKDKASKNDKINKLYDFIVKDKNLSFDSDIQERLKSRIYDPPVFLHLDESQAKIVREIIELLYETLPLVDAENLKRKIIEKYN